MGRTPITAPICDSNVNSLTVVRVTSWFSSWITPQPSIIDPNERREARVFLVAMLALLVSGLVFVAVFTYLFFQGMAQVEPLEYSLAILALGSLIISYSFAMKGQINRAALLLTGTVVVASWINLFSNAERLLPWAGHIILLTSVIAVVFLRPRALYMTHGVNVAMMFVLLALFPTQFSAWTLSMAFFVVGASALTFRRVLTDQSLKDLDRFTAEWKAVLASTDAAVGSIDRDLRLLSYNGAAQQLAPIFGLPELKPGIKLMDTLPEPVAHLVSQMLEPVFNGHSVDHKFTLSPGGQMHYINLSAKPMVSREGKILGAATLVRDITEEVLASARIEKRVENTRTAVLNAASHELNTPLTPLVIQLSLLKEGRLGMLNEVQQHALSTMDRSVRQLQRNVDAFLQATRMEQALASRAHDYINLSALVNHWVKSRDSGKRVNIGAIASEVHVTGDRRLLESALQHAVNTVLRWNQSGSPEVELQANQGHTTIRIKDPASTVDTPDLESIGKLLGDPFGLGGDVSLLSLYVCKKVVVAHGGSLEVNHDRTNGLDVALHIPQANPEGAAFEPVDSGGLPPETVQSITRPKAPITEEILPATSLAGAVATTSGT